MPTRSFRFALPTGEGILDALILPEGLHVQMGSLTYRLQSSVQMQLITGRCAICNLSVATVNGQTCENCLNVLLRVRNEARRPGSAVIRNEIIDAELARDNDLRLQSLIPTPEQHERMVRQLHMASSTEVKAMTLPEKTEVKATPRVKSRKRLMAEDPFKRK